MRILNMSVKFSAIPVNNTAVKTFDHFIKFYVNKMGVCKQSD
jgi:hypothetical protein